MYFPPKPFYKFETIMMRHIKQGFTLIELMITVAIIGILASIALPSYQDSVRKSRRNDAQGVLLGLANAMERHYTTNNNSYCDAGGAGGSDLCGSPGTNDDGTPSIYTIPPETASYYIIAISNTIDANSYTLTADRTGAQSNDKCGTLTLSNTGVKSVTNQDTGITATDCWK